MSFLSEVGVYVGRIRQFSRADWVMYLAWVGLMLGLFFATAGFLLVGSINGVSYPGEAYLIPIGVFVFTVSIAVDTIGHLTIYRKEIEGAEGLVHAITIFCGVGSVVLLCAAYSFRSVLWIPAMVLTVLSFFYSAVDEAFHWKRYVSEHADRVEMWSHVGILLGHTVMMIAWWSWFFQGYPGVGQTVEYL